MSFLSFSSMFFLCAPFLNLSLYFYSILSNTALLFFPLVFINSIIDFTLPVAWLSHLLMLLWWIALIFITMNPSNLAAVACSISSSTSQYNRNESLGRSWSCNLCTRSRALLAALAKKHIIFALFCRRP